MGWFKKFISFLADGFAKFMDIFASVSEAVVEFAIAPVLTLLIGLFSALTTALCEIMGLLGTSIPSMFLMDIGTGQSFFEITVGGLDVWMGITRVIAFCLLALFTFSAIIRSMTSLESRGVDSPVRVVVMTVVCAILIYAGPSIVIFIETKLCAPIYNFLLTWGQVDIDFSALNLADTLSDFMKEDTVFLEPTQGTTLLASVILFFVFLMITTRFIGFVFEIGQRYVILGLLIIMSPISFTFLVSKSSSTSFSKWVKMVGSQFFLMITNTIFIAVFFRGLMSFSSLTAQFSTMVGAGSMGKVSLVVMWGVLLYAILYIGGKVDSYLNTLGISTAEAGEDMMTAFVADVLDTGILERFVRGETPRRSNGPVAAAVRKFKASQQVKAETARGDKAVAADSINFRTTADGRTMPTVSSINETVKTMAANDVSLTKNATALTTGQRRELGKTVIAEARGIPQIYKNFMNPESCTIQNNSISMESHRDKDGSFVGVTMVPKELFSGQPMPAGRDVTIGDTEYRAIAYGPKAREFNTYNPIARKEIAQQYGGAAIASINIPPSDGSKYGTPTGVYQSTVVENGGRTATIHQWAPTSQFQSPSTVPTSVEHYGNMDYYHSQIQVPLDSGGKMVTECEHNRQIPGTGPASTADRANWTQYNFPTAMSQGFVVSGPSASDVLHFQKEGERYAFFPAAKYAVANGADGHPFIKDVQQVVAGNGAPYFACKESSIKEGAIVAKPHVGEENMGSEATVFVEQAPNEAQQFWNQSIPDIVKRAKEIRVEKATKNRKE